MTTVKSPGKSGRTGRPRGPRVVSACEVCGGPFEVVPSLAGKRLTCSEECKSLLRSLRAARRNGDEVTNLSDLVTCELSCEVCGGTFTERRCYKDRIRTCEGCRGKTASARTARRLEVARSGGIPDRTPKSVPGAMRVQQNCTICGSPYLIDPGSASAYSTCSRECSTRRRRDRGHGRVERACRECGGTFTVKVSQARARAAEYCSNACRLAGLNKLPRDPARTQPCRTCGKPFHCPENFSRPDADGKTRGVYCSRACMWTDDDYRKRRAVRHTPSNLEAWLFATLEAEGVRYESFGMVGRYVPDAILLDYPVIIEVDGVVWHRRRVAYDQQRDRDLMAAGYTILHFTSLELTSGKKTRELIGAALVDVRAGTAEYRPPMLWRPGCEPAA